MLWKGIWVHPYTVIMVQGGANFGNWGQAELKRHCGVIVEAVNNPTLHHTSVVHVYPTLHHTSIIHVYEVFEHLHMLWMGIWMHPYGYRHG